MANSYLQTGNTPMNDEALPLKCTISGYTVLKAYVEYEITVQRGPFSENNWKILKRYSDFNDLNQKLIALNITHPFPPKKYFGNMDPNFIQERQNGLQTFVDHIIQDPAISNTLMVQNFFDPVHFMERMHEEALEFVSMQLRSEPKWQIVEFLKDFGWRQRKHHSLAKSKVDLRVSDHILIMVENGPDLALGEKELNSALKTLCTIQHPYIYTTTFALPCEIGALILREFNPEGSLKDHIYKSKPRSAYGKKYGGKGRALPINDIKKFGRQIIEAVIFLKEKGFVMGHIHTGNVLVQSDVCRLTDLENSLLGLSSPARQHMLNFRKIQTLEGECVYSIGRLLYEMTFGESFKAGAIDMLPPVTPPQIRTLLESLITMTACKNGMPSLNQLLKDPENPFLRALKRVREGFVASSQEADQLVREAQTVCEPSSYDQKLEKKLNLSSGTEESRDCLDRIKEDIEKFSQTLHETESDGKTLVGKEDAHGVGADLILESENDVPKEEFVSSGEQIQESVTNSVVEEDERVNTMDSSGTKSPEDFEIHSEMLKSEVTPEIETSDSGISTNNLTSRTKDPYTPVVTEISPTNSVKTPTSPQSLGNYPKDLDPAESSSFDFFEDMEKLRQQFARDRDSIIEAKTIFDKNVRSDAALKIQTYWRGYHAKKLYFPAIQLRLETKIHSIVRIQSYFRRYLARQAYSRLVACRDRDRACVALQSWWRAFLAKRTYRNKILERERRKERASTLLKSIWKMYKCRMEYVRMCGHRRNMISACVVIQSFWRGCSSRKRFFTMREAMRLERTKQVNDTVVSSHDAGVETTKGFDGQLEHQDLHSDLLSGSSPCVLATDTTSPNEFSDCANEALPISSQLNNTDSLLESDELVNTIPPPEKEPDMEQWRVQESESPHQDKMYIAHSLLEELRQEWISRHSLWDEYFSQQPLPPPGKIQSDPIPPNAKPLTNSQLTSSNPSGPLRETTRLFVSHSSHPIDLSCLQKVPNLLSLSISDAPVSLEGLQCAQKLVDISIQHCGLSLVNLKALKNVHFTDFSHNRVSAIKGSFDFSRVRELVLNKNRLVQLGEIKKCINLQRLEVNSNLLVRGEGVEKLVCLLDLSCSQNHLSDLPQVSNCPLLQTVDLTDNNLLRYPALASHPLLTVVRLDDNSISDLEPLARAYLPSLQLLTLNGNSISKLVSFSALVLLERLELRLNYVEDLDSLVKCLEGNLRLVTLDMDGNPVTEEPRYRDSLKTTLICLKKLDNYEFPVPSTTGDDNLRSNGLLKLVDKQLEERCNIDSEHSARIRGLENGLSTDPIAIKELLDARIEFCRERLDLAVHHLREHEFYGTDKAIELLENKHTALLLRSAIVIQSHTRGYIVRKSFRKDVDKRAAITIQRSWRGHLSREHTHLYLLTRSRAAITIQARYKGWRVRRRLREVLGSLGEMEDSDGEDFEELLVDNWENRSSVEDRYELPQTPLGLYDDIIDSCIIQDCRDKLRTPKTNHPLPQSLRNNLDEAKVDKELVLAWSSRNSSSATVASNLTEQSNLSDEKSWTSIASDKPRLDHNIPPPAKNEALSPKDPWFLNNEQSIALFNKRAKKFKQGKSKLEEKSKLKDPLKRFEKLQMERDRRTYSRTSRVTPVPRQPSSRSISSQSSGHDSIYKWTDTSGSKSSAKILPSPPSHPQPTKKPDKSSFLPKLSSRVRAGYSPQLLTDFDTS